MELKFLKRPKPEPEHIRPDIPIAQPSPEMGLSSAQVEERMAAGYDNRAVEPPTKTVKEIILSNTFTYFNIVFFILAACVIAVGSWYNLTFLGVVFSNTLVGIVQELKSKRTLDKMSLLTSPNGVVIRDGKQLKLKTSELVRDDIVVFSAGNQIYADAAVVSGECMVNEALITGEADEIRKRPGEALLSGSFVVSGSCRAQLNRVGADSYVSRLTIEAKKQTGAGEGEMMRTLSKLVKWIGIALIPLGAALCVKEIYWLQRSVQDGVVSTVGALVGMIPEGLYLLTSVALVASIIRLMQRKTLVHDMACIETLARVDTLCVDKTGTITENKMTVEDIHPLCPDRYVESDIRLIMRDYAAAFENDNDTMSALKSHFSGRPEQPAMSAMPFSSAKKYSGVRFSPDETYLLGAPDVILGSSYAKYAPIIDGYAARGCRVLLLTLYDGSLEDFPPRAGQLPIALILLANKVRATAPGTFRFFTRQGVDIKVISGDNAVTVSEVARRAGIPNSDRFIDARTLDTEDKLRRAAVNYTVFGRVTPVQKRSLVRALKEAGRTVAMTGDGVNDVLALKEADCGVAMASGSDVACRAAHIVLMNSDFASMPAVVMEGRRVINNIERSASLFLVKNIFAFSLALISLFCALPFPLTPSQLSLVSTITIGIPSFILALEPNESLITGKFLRNVLYRALPAALTDLLMVLGVLLFYLAFDVPEDMMSTICAVVISIVGLMMLYRTSLPLNALRRLLLGAMIALFVLSLMLFPELFTISPLNFASKLVLAVFALLSCPTFFVLCRGMDKLRSLVTQRRKKK
ncbi:MAG: cation-translocating P-type ATPase [Candidatus Heteroscillospira sp.]|jgi:cation-transporting ATPase E